MCCTANRLLQIYIGKISQTCLAKIMLTFYTDGGCSRNGQKDSLGAVGVVALKDDRETFAYSRTYTDTTNNRMEYRALIFAMEMALKNNLEEPIFYTDSNLLVQTVNQWMHGWQKNGWKKKTSPKQIKNLDLVLRLWELRRALPRAQILWVKGHADNAWNNRADELATDFDLESASADGYDWEILDKYQVRKNLAQK